MTVVGRIGSAWLRHTYDGVVWGPGRLGRDRRIILEQSRRR